jgi:hypothetical protein
MDRPQPRRGHRREIKITVDQEAGSSTVEGGCLCGAVRYRATGPPSGITSAIVRRVGVQVAHPLLPGAGFAATSFSFTCGRPARYTSSAGVERSFCSRCGTQLTYRRLEVPDAVDVTMGSMDDPEALAPQDHTWVASRLSWIALSDGLPTYGGNRTS